MSKKKLTKKINFKKFNGLIPAIIQDNLTKQVLMLGFMNEAAYAKTLKTRKVTFYSRTRDKLWTKGEESGNFLKFIDIKIDCDQDTVLILAEPCGPTCHTGNYSCFGERQDGIYFLEVLVNIILDRKKKGGKTSYVASLFRDGLDRIVQKVGEEAIETVIAAKNKGKQELIYEASDLIFHLLILLQARKIKLEDIIGELMRRHEER